MSLTKWGFYSLIGALFMLLLMCPSQAVAADVSAIAFSRDLAWNNTYSKGMALYNENCSICHGESGQGGTEEGATGLPLNLQSFLTVASKDFIVNTIKNGRPSRQMPPFAGDLKSDEISAIATYVKGWQFEPSKAIEQARVSGISREGAKWYRGICANCHGIRGEGGPGHESGGQVLESFAGFSAPALADVGFQKSASDGLIKGALMYGIMGTPMTSYLKGMQGIAELTEKDINDIVAYIRTMPSIKGE